MDAFAISECSAEGLESPTIIGAQAANELLEIRGMKASVVLTDYNGTIYFSARSIDEVNVQVMMEKLGGGGHRTIAGAQMKGVTVEEAKERLKARCWRKARYPDKGCGQTQKQKGSMRHAGSITGRRKVIRKKRSDCECE